MIGIGCYYRGPELEGSPVDRTLDCIRDAIKLVIGNWEIGEVAAYIVLFVVPGSLGDANFEGQRVTLFSHTKKLLQIEIAMPRTVVECGDVLSFSMESLRQAADIAEQTFLRKKVFGFSAAFAKQVIDQVERDLNARKN